MFIKRIINNSCQVSSQEADVNARKFIWKNRQTAKVKRYKQLGMSDVIYRQTGKRVNHRL